MRNMRSMNGGYYGQNLMEKRCAHIITDSISLIRKSEHRFTRMIITKSHKNIDKSEKLNNEKYGKIERKE